MADDGFNPYHKWLGIPPEEMPPHHYQLLGLAPFEPDFDVIENAADARRSYLRTVKDGEQAEMAERLVEEIDQAATCLLSKTGKSHYDDLLGSARPDLLETPEEVHSPVPTPPPGVGAPPLQAPPPQPPSASQASQFPQPPPVGPPVAQTPYSATPVGPTPVGPTPVGGTPVGPVYGSGTPVGPMMGGPMQHSPMSPVPLQPGQATYGTPSNLSAAGQITPTPVMPTMTQPVGPAVPYSTPAPSGTPVGPAAPVGPTAPVAPTGTPVAPASAPAGPPPTPPAPAEPENETTPAVASRPSSGSRIRRRRRRVAANRKVAFVFAIVIAIMLGGIFVLIVN